MARDTYIIRPKQQPRPTPEPVTRETRIAIMAREALKDVARKMDDRPHTPRRERT